MTLRNVPGPILKNRGVPVSVHRLGPPADGEVGTLERILDSADEPVFDERYIKLTNLVLSDIEEKFGDLDAWQLALSTTPFKSTVDTLALVWEVDRRTAGAMMVDGDLDDYSTALGAAFMMANGSDAEATGKVLVQGIKAAKEQRTAMAAAVAEMMALEEIPTADTPGQTTSEDGSAPAEVSTSSGP